MIRAVVAVLLVVVLLAAGTLAALLWFPAPLLRAGLRAAGVETVAFDDLRLGPAALELSGLQVGTPPDHRVARLQIRYSLSDLLRGEIESIEVEGLELHGRIVGGRVELAGFAPADEPGEQAGLAPLPWPRQVVLRDATVELATAWGELHLPVRAELEPTAAAAAFRLEVTDGRLINDAGRLQVDLALQGKAPLDRTLTLTEVSAAGEASVTAVSFAVPQIAERLDGRGTVAFELADGRLEARLASEELRVATLGAELTVLAERLPPPWQLRLGEGAEPFRIAAELDQEPIAVELDGTLGLAAGAARVAAALTGSLAVDADGGLSEIAGRAGVTLDQVRWQDALLEHGQLELQGEGTPARWQGTLELELAGRGEPTPELVLEEAVLRHSLTASLSDRRLTLTPRAAGALTIGQATWRGAASAGPLAWRLERSEPALLALTFAPDGGIAWRHELRAKGEAADLTLQATEPPLAARAEVAELAISLAGDEAGLDAGRIALAGGALRLPAMQIALDGIATEIALAADGLATDQAIPLTIATIAHGGTPAWFAPLAFRGSLRPGAERILFDARLSRPAGALTLTLRGQHEPAAERGRAEIALAPLTFAPGERQPGQLAPVLGGLIEEGTGTVALDGTIGWGASAAITADLALLVEDLAFTIGPARLVTVNGVVNIDQLWPLTTPPGQQLAIGLLDLGLPLTRGLVTFEILADPALAVERLRWDFAGGTVRAEPFRVGSATSDITLTLNASGLDLAQLFALTRLDGLSGEGTIGGTLPVRITGSEAVIEGGELRAVGPGWLRYRPDAAPAALQAGGENVNLLLQALENFHYEALRITLDGRTDAEMDIGLHVQGANPELYDGYPIEFNLDLEGELANILRSGLATYQIPERIREQMQGFRR